jgi:hypothetical protein
LRGRPNSSFPPPHGDPPPWRASAALPSQP